ncbi:MAG: mismatch-specific DNA-glycosylase [Gemmatales bacterium]|nr:MAG: mismatch-specific DNA-glycosylase [Gemmatales bacterium]
MVAKPTQRDLSAAAGKRIADVIAPGLDVLLCGINPSLYSAAVGCHFARPGNRFWPALFHAGITDRLLSPSEQRQLLQVGFGITNLVARATARASELTAEELRRGRIALARKTRLFRPRLVAFLGITAYRTAFDRPDAVVGPQPHSIADARVWVLPNPSGLNAHFQLPDLTRQFAELYQFVKTIRERSTS